MSFQQLPGYEGDPALAPTAAAAFNCPEFISGVCAMHGVGVWRHLLADVSLLPSILNR